MYEDNAACIAQLRGGYIKGDRTKHISLKFFFTHDLQQNGEIEVQQILSSDNLADLFTKALPTSTFEKLRYKIGMCTVFEISSEAFIRVSEIRVVLFFFTIIFSQVEFSW